MPRRRQGTTSTSKNKQIFDHGRVVSDKLDTVEPTTTNPTAEGTQHNHEHRRPSLARRRRLLLRTRTRQQNHRPQCRRPSTQNRASQSQKTPRIRHARRATNNPGTTRTIKPRPSTRMVPPRRHHPRISRTCRMERRTMAQIFPRINRVT